MQISTYTTDTVKIIGSCVFDVVYPDTKKLVPVTFYIANNDGSVLLSCKTTLALQLIKPQSRLDYLPPWASLITSTMDHPKKTKMTALKVHWSKQEVSDQRQQPPSKALTSRNTVQKQDPAITITSKEQILLKYPDVFKDIGYFRVCHTTYKSIWTLHWNKLCVGQYWSTLKKPSKKKLTRCYKPVSSGQLQKPLHGSTVSFNLKVRTSQAIQSYAYVLIWWISIKQSYVNHIILKHWRTSFTWLPIHASWCYAIVRRATGIRN